MRIKRRFFMIPILVALLFCLTAIPFGYADIVSLPIDLSGGMPAQADGFRSDTEYKDDSIHVRLEEGYAFDTPYWAAYVTLSNAFQLRTAAAGSFQSGRCMPSTALAKRVNAILAINGDYFSYISDGYLIRQGEMYRNLPPAPRDTLLIDENGDFHIVVSATAEKLEAYKDIRIINSFNFGPALVVDGIAIEKFTDRNDAAFEARQRVMIAQTGPLEYLCVVTEGPLERNSKGLTLPEFAQLTASFNVKNAYNLDGGYSSAMIFRNIKINAPGNSNHRDINDIIYFASACTSPEESKK